LPLTDHRIETIMLFKSVIVIMLILILISLNAGLFFLVKDKGHGKRTVNALTIRIGLSVALFLMLIVGFYTGAIQPHGVYG
jgi:hypothetical protein